MHEISTALTDYLLALVALLFAYRTRCASRGALACDVLVFFLGAAAAALLGGSVHGFFPDETTSMYRLLWWFTQLGTGIAALGLSMIGTRLLGIESPSISKVLIPLVLVAYATYAWLHPSFLSSVIASVFGTLVCVVGLARHVRRTRNGVALLAIAGLAGSILAAMFQQRGLALTTLGFDHNTVYHLLLMPSLWLFYAGMRGLVNYHE